MQHSPFENTRLEPNYHAPYGAWKLKPDLHNTTRLLTALKPVIDSGVRTYAGAAASPITHSKAKRIVLDALPRYDPSQAPLKAHLFAHLQGLQRYTAQHNQLISVPEAVTMDRKRLDDAERELSDYHGRTPSTYELADHLQLSPKRIAYIRQYKPGFTEGQAAGQQAEGGPYETSTVQPETHAKFEFLYHDLAPTDQVLLEHTLGLHGREKLRVGALARKLNLTPSAVSQRATRLQAMADALDGTGVL